MNPLISFSELLLWNSKLAGQHVTLRDSARPQAATLVCREMGRDVTSVCVQSQDVLWVPVAQRKERQPGEQGILSADPHSSPAPRDPQRVCRSPCLLEDS